MNSLPRIQDFGKAMKQFLSVASGQTKTNLTIFRLSPKIKQKIHSFHSYLLGKRFFPNRWWQLGHLLRRNRLPGPGQPRINSRSIETPPAKAQSSTSGATSQSGGKVFFTNGTGSPPFWMDSGCHEVQEALNNTKRCIIHMFYMHIIYIIAMLCYIVMI